MLRDEEKEALRNFKSEYETCDHYSSDLIIELDDAEIILNLIEKQSKEIEEYKKQLDLDYVDKHFVAIERYNQLEKEIEELKKENLEIRDWKYVIDSLIDLDKLKELDLIKIKGKEYVSKDKIKAKIEELEKIIQILEAKPYTAYTLYGDILHESDEIAQMLKEVLEKE